MELSEETEWISPLRLVRVPEEAFGFVKTAIVHERVAVEQDVVSGEVAERSGFTEREAREPTVLEVGSESTEETELPGVVRAIGTVGLRCEITAG